MPAEIRHSYRKNDNSDTDGEKDGAIIKKKKKCRRSNVTRNQNRTITIMYANIQGIRGKMTSLKHVMSMCKADIVLLTETINKIK